MTESAAAAIGYLTYERDLPAETGRKTQVWRVLAARDGYPLGVIKWHGPWRQYAFFPGCDTIWNPDCLDSINGWIRGLMRQRSRAKKRAALAAPTLEDLHGDG